MVFSSGKTIFVDPQIDPQAPKKASEETSEALIFLVRQARFEPATHGLEGLPAQFLRFFWFFRSPESPKNRHFSIHVFHKFHCFRPLLPHLLPHKLMAQNRRPAARKLTDS